MIARQAAAVSAGEVLALLYDIHGSTRGLVDTTGVIHDDVAGGNGVQAFTFDAYGNLIPTGFGAATQAAALTSLLYSGEFTHAVTGQQYLRARFYDPSSGRFNCLDPYAGNTSGPLSLNKYQYTHGNPIMGVDPSGMFITVLELLVTNANQLVKQAPKAKAAKDGYQAAKGLHKAIKMINQLRRGAERVWDTMNAIADAMDLLELDPDDLRQITNDLNVFQTPGIEATIKINLPSGVTKKMKNIVGRIGGRSNPVVQELLAVMAAALTAQVTGHRMTGLSTGYHGIDGIFYNDMANRFLIIEAKGGSARLKGDQMRKMWLDTRIDRLIQRNGGKHGGNVDAKNLYVGAKSGLTAMVVSLDLWRRNSELAIRTQNYPGFIKPWGSPFK